MSPWKILPVALGAVALLACGDEAARPGPLDAGTGRVIRECEYNPDTRAFDRNCVVRPPGGWDGGPGTTEAWCTRPGDGGARECLSYGDTPFEEPHVCISCGDGPVDPRTGLERCLRTPCGPSDGGRRD